ncbi:SDR family NAD(P)-dependent oxidoreductase [Ginsengibacter hankyongi]|uniref:SDR family NAD(P)-dependent oxidoreductase n=1 Tax=Ginsengibacter hankyongi TaxID=2607284 RepID=A0A5J5IFL3_9BACT|nr:SDR family NAD(P)-dependent oxidoreductase [Ginsengibacter hankyongi]KAA9039100.1 SDR family NAD(P)-dependent oxidoreductase [Ginsengibacter hankyongi]
MKTIMITGATGNMGQAVVKKFVQEGYFVIGTVIPNDTTPINFPADKFEKVVVDLGDEEASGKFIDTVISKYKSVDAAVLTVGGFAMGSIVDTKTSDIEKQYKLNFETAYNVARPVFIQMLKQNSGRIFIIGSKPGLDARNGKGMVAYGLAKSLIFRLAELMNAEAKGKNVVTSVVVPSTIDTPPNRKAMPEAHFDNWVKPEAIADVIYWHCTDEAAALREPVLKVYNNA